MTVSFVLNNKQGQVGEETREKVLKAIRDLDYRPRAVEHSARQRKILTLGMLAGVDGHSLVQPGYYQAIVNGILPASDLLQHNITLFTHSIFHADPHQSVRIYCDGRCDGLMVLAPNCGSKLVAALHARGTPFVLIGDTGDEETISYVDIDNVREGRRVTEYLIGRGHRRVAFVGGPHFVRSSKQRLEGYSAALQAHGIPFEPDYVVNDNLYERDSEERLVRLLRSEASRRPTALFGWNDGAAVEGIRIASELGLSVPGDLSVVGIDAVENANHAYPNLTTLRQPYDAIGTAVLNCLVDLIRGTASGPQRLFLPTEWVEGNSVAPPLVINNH